MRIICIFFLFVCGSFTAIQAQQLVKDATPSNASAHPRLFTNVAGTTYFVTGGFNTSSELWKTNGTTAGTVRVKDPNVSPQGPYFDSNNTIYLTPFGNKLLFNAYSYSPSSTGTELWITDGTTAGTQLLKDINPGSNSSWLNSFTVVGNKAYFVANDGTNGYELWVTDGTTAGTQLLRDIYSGSNSSYPSGFTILNDKLLFTAFDNTNGQELWITDGTPAGTQLLKDIYGGSNSSNPSSFRVLGDKVLFTAFNNSTGSELWATDGTSAGTQLLKDIYVGSGSSSISNLTILGGKMIFYAHDGNTNYGGEFWITDGTPTGTVLLKDLYLGSNSSFPTSLLVLNGQLYFTVGTLTNGGYGLYKTDGTTTGTVLVKQFPDNDSRPQDPIAFNNMLYFTAADGINGRELWKSDGTTAGTVMVKDINPNSTENSNFTFPTSGRVFRTTNSKLFFLANSGVEGFELWSTDGTAAGTVLIKDFITSHPRGKYSNFLSHNNLLYFLVNDDTGDYQCWKSDGTTAGTTKVGDLNPSLGLDRAYPLYTTATDTYLVGHGNEVGYELFKTDGTSLSLVKDVLTVTHQTEGLRYRTTLNNKIIYSFNDNRRGLEWWKSDGTAAGTDILLDINKYPNNNYYSNFNGSSFFSNSSYLQTNPVTFQGYTYFVSYNSTGLWRTDGQTVELWNTYNSTPYSLIATANNKLRWLVQNQLYEFDGTTTTLVKTIPNFSGYFYYSNPTFDVGGITYFHFPTSTEGGELWRTDGTEAGTYLLKDIAPGSTSSYPSNFTQVGTKTFFTASTFSEGTELWLTDGTSAGTTLVKDISVGSSSSYPQLLTKLNDNTLIFNAYNSANGTELWKSDGTAAGTIMLQDIWGGSNGSYPQNYGSNPNTYTLWNNKLYFSAYNGSASGLYATDGNTVTLVKNSLYVENIVSFDNQLWMSGYDNVTNKGSELYKSDGTSAGTVIAKDINPGTSSSNPQSFFVVNDRMYFVANDGRTGEELYVLIACPDSLNLQTTLMDNKTYQAGKVIVGENANIINPGTNVTYDAGKYVLLKPGFTAENSSTFLAKIGGCATMATTTTNPQQSTKNTLNEKTKQYLEYLSEAPSISEFLGLANDATIQAQWERFEEISRPLYANMQQIEHEMRLVEQQTTTTPTAQTYQLQGELMQEKQDAQQAAERYKWLIYPVLDKAGQRTGYALEMFLDGKKISKQIDWK